MGKGLITRRGGGAGEPTPPPSINFVSATFDSITFTITNNSVSARDITYGFTTPPEDTSIILGGSTTSDEIILSALDDGTSYTIYAQAEDSTIIEVTLSTLAWEPIQATGGTITTIGDYRVHSFTSTGTSNFVVNNAGADGEIHILMVAGGGAGGSGTSGGGGAGGLIYYGDQTPRINEWLALTNGAATYPIVVGAGAPRPPLERAGARGNNTTAFGLTSIGGGGGGSGGSSNFSEAPTTGGSGGAGGMYTHFRQNGAAGTTSPGSWIQGFQGGNASAISSDGGHGGGGGGGGSSAAGQNMPASNIGGAGGNGRSYNIRTGSNIVYAGGGGGGSNNQVGAGGTGGGGAGGLGSSNGVNGINNLGGGGGGAWTYANGQGGAGGSGIVIISYPLVRPN